VRATSDRIWQLIAELDQWQHWNPVHPGASGRIGFGEKITVVEAYPHEERREITAVVTDWTPLEQLVWRTDGFLWTARRYLEIEELAPGSCIFSNGILYEGRRAKGQLRRRGAGMKIAFGILGEALKERAEREG
jgi:hypothetical protein